MKIVVHYIRLIKKEGPVQLLLELLKENKSNKIKNVIVTCGYDDFEYFSEFSKLPIEIYFYKRINFLGILFRLIVLKNKFSTINFHTYCTTGILYSTFLPVKFNRVHSCLIEIGLQAISMNGYLKGNIINFVNNQCYSRMDVLAAGSSGVAKTLQKYNYKKVITINNCVSKNNYNVHYYDHPKKYILTICRLSNEKNLKGMIEFYKKLKNPDFDLLIIGDGPLYNDLKNLSNGISGIVFLGFVKNFEYYLKNAQLYLSFSFTEGLPMAVLSAMSFGLPLLLSDIDGHVECINENGYLFDVHDFEDFENKIFDIFNKKDIFSLKSKKIFEQKFSSEIMYNKFLNIYE